jgi:hypothetical protein|tara:strand:+ start:8253 stop:8669 length:417 start_codon:yes stop_codon:yes gene_type:complete
MESIFNSIKWISNNLVRNKIIFICSIILILLLLFYIIAISLLAFITSNYYDMLRIFLILLLLVLIITIIIITLIIMFELNLYTIFIIILLFGLISSFILGPSGKRFINSFIYLKDSLIVLIVIFISISLYYLLKFILS